MKPTTLSSFIVITQTLLNHVVTADLQVYHIECMRNEEPHCCEEPCGWQQENITEDGNCEVFGDYMTCLFDKETRNLTTPSNLRKTAAQCKIHKKKQKFHMSCYHGSKPICCDTPCECDLNLLNATCKMQEKSMECSCAGSGSADNPVLNFCFKNTCLHKTDHKGCDFQADDTCYISIGVTDGKGQKQESKQVSDEDKKEMKDNNVTEPEPGLSSGAVAGIAVGVLVLVAVAAAVGVIYHRRKISELQKQISTVTVTETEGESVTLKPNKEIKKDEIQWLFGEGKQQTGVAHISGKTGEIVTHDDAAGGRFRGRLELDGTTGSLIIMNSTTADSGLYTLEITSSGVASEQRFMVTVNETLEEKTEEGGSVTLYPDPLNPDTEIQRDDLILWTFGDQEDLIALIRGGTGEIYDNAARGIFRDRLEVSETTGSLTITDITPEHTGRYKLQIFSSRGILCKKFRVSIPCSSGKRGNKSASVEMQPLMNK